MDSMIRETNENLRAIVDNLKSTLDTSVNTLENIQLQMDKKVDEAKKYKVQVDNAKEQIKLLEEENDNLDQSLRELSEKYSKMNLVSVIEAGNKEIKAKINNNLTEINKLRAHIADLTNKARTIKDLLISLKKDKTVKEEKLENLSAAYEYYNDKISEVIEYALSHENNLMDYKEVAKKVNYEEKESEVPEIDEIENTMIFDEIANIDNNKNFKDEMSFIDDQINSSIQNDEDEISDDDINKLVEQSFNKYDIGTNETDSYEEDNSSDDETSDEVDDSTAVFDTILGTVEDKEPKEDLKQDKPFIEPTIDNTVEPISVVEPVIEETNVESNDNVSNNNDESVNTTTIQPVNDIEPIEEESLDNESADRINKINDLFSSINNDEGININSNNANDIESKIDNAYQDVFGQPLEEEKKDPTLTDIFGNPIKEENLNETKSQSLEELFTENGIDFKKFKDDEQNYLREIYDYNKFLNILNTLKRNKINLDNIYYAFNIFGEISANEMEGIISKLINAGQSVEAIGLILEKLPKIKKYNLDEAIISFGDYIKDIDITELITKAKELYNNGGNQ